MSQQNVFLDPPSTILSQRCVQPTKELGTPQEVMRLSIPTQLTPHDQEPKRSELACLIRSTIRHTHARPYLYTRHHPYRGTSPSVAALSVSVAASLPLPHSIPTPQSSGYDPAAGEVSIGWVAVACATLGTPKNYPSPPCQRHP